MGKLGMGTPVVVVGYHDYLASHGETAMHTLAGMIQAVGSHVLTLEHELRGGTNGDFFDYNSSKEQLHQLQLAHAAMARFFEAGRT